MTKALHFIDKELHFRFDLGSAFVIAIWRFNDYTFIKQVVNFLHEPQCMFYA